MISPAGFIAHVRQSDSAEQSLYDHLTKVAVIVAILADKLGLGLAGELIGLMHDFGKYSQAFQAYIRSVTGLSNPDEDDGAENLKGKIDHSTAGAQWVFRHLRVFEKGTQAGWLAGQILGLCIASHHGAGLIDCLSPEEQGELTWLKRFKKSDDKTHFQECISLADAAVLERAKQLASVDLIQQLMTPVLEMIQAADTSSLEKEFYLGCMTRFLHSCLIDADRINSADFEDKARAAVRRIGQKTDWQPMIDRLEAHLAQWEPKRPIDHIRNTISETCHSRAQDQQGIYTLTVPTGGGKTFASLRYALHHAQKHGLDRIIYIIPYTSIIEQNAGEVRKVLGDDCVLEHHSNLEPEQETWKSKLLCENWDSPIVFTTMVQFLDSFFGSGTRGVRHIHAMTRSVLIFDEVQTLPLHCTYLFCNTINWLTRFGKSTTVLCTATQPVLDHLPKLGKGQLKLAERAELMGDAEQLKGLFEQLSRVNIEDHCQDGGWSLEQTKDLILKEFERTQSVLVIVNTKQWARQLFEACQSGMDKSVFHLSTHQCAKHREVLLNRIKRRLKWGLPVLCISTQLIEAGVDVSFACVVRALAGLDSVAQAAGRCNRHGEQDKGRVLVINLQNEHLQVLPDIQCGQLQVGRVFRELGQAEWLNPDAISLYFNYYFFDKGQEEKLTYPLKENKSSLLSWLSDNAQNNYLYKNDSRLRSKLVPLLMQSFRSAARAFEAIDSPTQAVIVPYRRRGEAIVTELCAAWGEHPPRELLREAQRYTVNVFPNMWKKLIEASKHNEVLHEINGTGIYYLNKTFYSDFFGLADEKVADMPTLNV